MVIIFMIHYFHKNKFVKITHETLVKGDALCKEIGDIYFSKVKTTLY